METRSKKDIRAEVKKHRREATPEQIRENSNAICEKFLSLPEYAEAKAVFAYMDWRVGKRTLVKIKDEVEKLPDWVKQFYELRCEAEGITFPG